ncbi:hypothetical protein [Flavobacterium sp. MDT1-60]|uniref:hypothetical protein n=1 Tax=Flavobacterium sp. MDT1-60 TaxID=1979344 RepID=UPI0017845EF6|nr:hypothetical protein [Flavobacterium sp. MDT1-60]QOG03661.1 hypothetical protein IHE43_05365 [Flavobacterium sp. MDT1-60]
MKKSILLATFCVALFSCSSDDTSTKTDSSLKKDEIFNFQSYEGMDKKIDEISEIKTQLEKSIAEKHISKVDNSSKNNSEDAILESVKNYHKEKLNNIYALRKQTNFTSIQSIADEINFLTLIDSIKSDALFEEYKKYLIRDKYEVKTILKIEQQML